jgi:prepilin-type N-terminal cleavage/methylation domain-containing protein
VPGPRSVPAGSDDGFTVIEMSITMIVFSIIAALTLLLVTSMLDNSTSVNDTLMGVSQASVANRSFTEYLRSISDVYQVNPNPLGALGPTGQSLEFIANVGTGTHAAGCPGQTVPSTGVEVICSEDVIATLANTKSPSVDELEVFYGSSWIPSNDRLIASFDIVPPCCSPLSANCLAPPLGNFVPGCQAPTAQIFQYYTLGGATGTTLINEGATWAAANPTLIQGIGFDAAFLPPPGPGKQGFSAELGTVVHTIAFIRNPPPTG